MITYLICGWSLHKAVESCRMFTGCVLWESEDSTGSHPALNERVSVMLAAISGFWRYTHSGKWNWSISTVKSHPDANSKMGGVAAKRIQERGGKPDSHGCMQASKQRLSQGFSENRGQWIQWAEKKHEEEGPAAHFSPLHSSFVWVVVRCIAAAIKCRVGVKCHLSWVERLQHFSIDMITYNHVISTVIPTFPVWTRL